MSVSAAIHTAEGLLPGEPAPDGVTDPRWEAIIAVAEYIPDYPEEVWQFARRWGAHEQEDVRMAIATCVLEHLLEHHFDLLFDRVEAVARDSPLFMDTVSQCWKFGQSLERRNSKRLDRLIKGARRAS